MSLELEWGYLAQQRHLDIAGLDGYRRKSATWSRQRLFRLPQESCSQLQLTNCHLGTYLSC